MVLPTHTQDFCHGCFEWVPLNLIRCPWIGLGAPELNWVPLNWIGCPWNMSCLVYNYYRQTLKSFKQYFLSELMSKRKVGEPLKEEGGGSRKEWQSEVNVVEDNADFEYNYLTRSGRSLSWIFKMTTFDQPTWPNNYNKVCIRSCAKLFKSS